MKLNEIFGWFAGTFGASGLGGAVSNFVLGRNKQAMETLIAQLDRNTLRITTLEKDHRDCMESHAETKYKVGRLEGELAVLKARVENGHGS